jgi:hypothetical protein
VTIAAVADADAPVSATRTAVVKPWRIANLLRENRFQERANLRNALLSTRASRNVFTADVSVDEVQAFIRDLVRLLGRFTPLGSYGR